MKRFFKYTALILMVLMISGSAWALTYTDHVAQAPNNKGEVLIFPWYLALDGGWQTKLTVINTNESESVVAKLIIRSFKVSEELLDFFLYLSPADVWTGTIKYDSNLKKVVIFSNDDSVLSSIIPTPVWANVTPINQPMFALSCSGDGDFLGYVEVITAAAGWIGASPRFSDTPGVSKTAIFNAYNALVTGVGDRRGLRFAGDYDNTTDLMVRPNWLAGFQQLQNLTVSLDSALSATNLKDYGNREAMTTGSETRLGADADNNLAEIEAALSKDDIAVPYVKGDDVALHLFTFPTKLTATCNVNSGRGPYFTSANPHNADGCPDYTIVTYDLQEHFPLSGSPFSGGGSSVFEFCNEVNFVSSAAFEFAEGWAHYAFNHTTTTTNKTLQYLRYDGTPVIASYLYLGKSGLSTNYAAWTDDLVFCSSGATTLIDFQYTDLPVAGCIVTQPPA